MADPRPAPQEANEFEREFPGPLTRPEAGDEGMGPTLGEDVGVEHQKDEDRRNHADGATDGGGI